MRITRVAIKMSSMSTEVSTSAVEVIPEEVQANKMTTEDIRLVQWEEWALSLEEHFHAQELFARNPNGNPMGHR